MKSYTLRPDTFTLNFNLYSVRYHPFSPNGFESQEDIFRNIMYGVRKVDGIVLNIGIGQ